MAAKTKHAPLPLELVEDLRWIEDHADELYEKYEGEWVAVVNKKIVAHGKDGGKVQKEAIAKTRRDRSRIAMTYLEYANAFYRQTLV